MPPVLWQTALTTRGFTGHEELDEVGLVHMNGRVYDPQLGRFLSADPVVQDATDLQAYNHYAYVRNNPLSLLDPSGFSWIGDVFKSIGNFFSHAFSGIASAFKSIFKNAIFRAVIQIAACAAAPGIGCAIAAAGLTLLGGGTPLQALKAFAFAEISQMVWTNVGATLRAEGVAGNLLVKGLVHGVVGGALSVAQGGHFMQGFAANAIGADTGLIAGTMTSDMYLHTAIVGAAGGLASVMTGGKFENGVVTAGFANLFNFWQLALLSDAGTAAAVRIGVVLGLMTAASETVPDATATQPPLGIDSKRGLPQSDDDDDQQQYVVRGGVGAVQNFMTGTTLSQNGYGFSVQTAPGVSIDELARGGGIPNNQISVSTVGQLLQIPGVTVNAPTPGYGDYHGTVNLPYPPPPGIFDAIAAAFVRMPNPYPTPRY